MNMIQKQSDILMDFESHNRFMKLKRWSEEDKLDLKDLFRCKKESLKYYKWLEEYKKAQEDFVTIINEENKRTIS